MEAKAGERELEVGNLDWVQGIPKNEFDEPLGVDDNLAEIGNADGAADEPNAINQPADDNNINDPNAAVDANVDADGNDDWAEDEIPLPDWFLQHPLLSAFMVVLVCLPILLFSIAHANEYVQTLVPCKPPYVYRFL